MKQHEWRPIESSKGVWGYHMYKCAACGKETHIGLDIDYEAPECCGDKKQPREIKKAKGE